MIKNVSGIYLYVHDFTLSGSYSDYLVCRHGPNINHLKNLGLFIAVVFTVANM